LRRWWWCCLLFLSACGLEEKEGMVLVDGRFWMDVHPDTVAQFRTFVTATAYRTDAERFGNGAVFNFETGQWEMVDGAMWERPFGTELAKDNHPVTQVSWQDAMRMRAGRESVCLVVRRFY
jgi:sulfatase modifying factor 1